MPSTNAHSAPQLRPRARIRDRSSRTGSAPPAEPRSDRFVELLTRLGWMVAGPATLFVLAASIAQSPGRWHLDLVYVAALIVTVFVRFADVAWFHGTTSTGEPGTLRHVRRYAAGLVVASAGAWCVARVVGFIVGT